MTKPLHPAASTRIGAVELRTPGLRGTVRLRSAEVGSGPGGPGLGGPGLGGPGSGGLGSRGPGLTDAGLAGAGAAAGGLADGTEGLPQGLAEALERSGVRWLDTVELSDLRLDQPAPGAAEPVSRPIQLLVGAPTVEEPAAPAPAEAAGMVALTTDDLGVLRWRIGTVPPGGGQVMFELPATVAGGPADGGPSAAEPALFGGLGKLLVHVLTFPLGGLAGQLASRVIRSWEGRARPPRLRPFGPQNYAAPFAGVLTSDDWSRLAAGPALLFVHGTFSQADSGFGAIPVGTVAALHAQYDGRVFAFDHPTVGASPNENVDSLLQLCRQGLAALPVDALDVDIVCHSRGGLVSRLLAERASREQPVRVRKVVFVASPNGGTQLCDTRHMTDLIDRYTNLLALIPNPAVAAFEAVVELVKTVAASTVDRLDGLHAMCPSPTGEFLTDLNKDPQVTVPYFGLGSDYEPPPGLKTLAWGRDGVMDVIFRRDTVHGLEAIANDLVVPTAGVWDLGGDTPFPFAEHVSWGRDRAIDHSGYFADPQSMDRLSTWLTRS
jgi:hypothetical protein